MGALVISVVYLPLSFCGKATGFAIETEAMWNTQLCQVMLQGHHLFFVILLNPGMNSRDDEHIAMPTQLADTEATAVRKHQQEVAVFIITNTLSHKRLLP